MRLPDSGWARLALATVLVALVAGACAPAVVTPSVISAEGSASPSPTAQTSRGTAAAGSTGGSPTPSLAHFHAGRIGFDYPAGWSVRPSGLRMHYVTVVAFVGTAPSTASCTSPTPNSVTCRTDFALAPGTVGVEVETQDGPPVTDPLTRAAHPEPGTQVVSIDGAPAFLSETPAAQVAPATRGLALEVPDPAVTYARTWLRAEIRGPGEDELVAQVQALFASVRYEPPLRPTSSLDAAAAAAASARAVAALAATDSAYACFPRVPGTSNHAVVRQLPFLSRLRKPLPVTCSTAIEGTPLELWRLRLTTAWVAARDRSAGTSTVIAWVGLDGNPTETTGSGAASIPHWP